MQNACWFYVGLVPGADSRANILHPILSVLHPTATKSLRSQTIVKTIFKLKTRSTAISAKNDQRSAIPIPANATVVLVVGDLDEDAFVKIRYGDKALFM